MSTINPFFSVVDVGVLNAKGGGKNEFSFQQDIYMRICMYVCTYMIHIRPSSSTIKHFEISVYSRVRPCRMCLCACV